MIYLIKKYFSLPINEKLLFLELLYFSLISRLLIVLLPFKKLETFFGKKANTPTFWNTNNTIENEIRQIKKTLNRVKKIIPWRFQCFEQSLTTAFALKRRNIAYTMYFGVQRQQNNLNAHVWIISHNIEIVSKGLNHFAELLIYQG